MVAIAPEPKKVWGNAPTSLPQELCQFLRATAYALARICYRPPVRPSVRHTGGSVKNG